jgi:hypothetical protein
VKGSPVPKRCSCRAKPESEGGDSPAAGSPERRLLQDLHRRGLLLEPFERAGIGLHEVYGEPDAQAARP